MGDAVLFPVTAFEIRGKDNEYIRLEISEIYGFPNETSFRGGYDIKCRLEIASGVYGLATDNYFSSTGALRALYSGLSKCYAELSGKCSYGVFHAENDLTFDISFEQGQVAVFGRYQDEDFRNNILCFEFDSDQSYFSQVLADLKNVLKLFDDGHGLSDNI